MINGNITQFLDKLYYGDEFFLEYKSIKYFLQGWTKNSIHYMVLDKLEEKPFIDYIWKTEQKSMRLCAEEFLKSPIWNGKTFMQVQKKITWLD